LSPVVSWLLVTAEVVVTVVETPTGNKLTTANRAEFHVAAEVVEAAVEYIAVVTEE
jgi:hypothetical protein